MRPTDRHCPVCAAPAPDAPDECPRCRTELGGYWRVAFHPWAVYNRALVLADEGRTAAAARSAFAAVELEPRRAEFRLLLARLLADLDELDEAIDHATHAAELTATPDEADSLLQRLYEKKYPADPAPKNPAPDDVPYRDPHPE